MLTNARQEVNARIIDRGGFEVGFQTTDGGAIDVSAPGSSYIDNQGFYIKLAPGATEGLLYVKPWSGDTYKLLPFFLGINEMLVKGVAYSVSNTATSVYWAK
jgi:hypothetical protein